MESNEVVELLWPGGRSGSRSLKGAGVALVLGSTVAFSAVALAQTAVPDAQVEANVLKALASAPDLATEDIHTRTVYGVVTLTGSVRNGELQSRAENLAADSDGVKKVVDELRVGDSAQPTNSASAPDPDVRETHADVQAANNAQPLPGSAPASGAVMNDPDHDQQQGGPDQGAQPASGPVAQQQQTPSAQPPYEQQPQSYPPPTVNSGRRPLEAGGYPGAPEYGQDQRATQDDADRPNGGYPQPGYGQPQQPGYGPGQAEYGPGQPQPPYQQPPTYGGQQAGRTVVVPNDSMIRVRLNQSISSNRSTPGSHFDATVMSDVVADGVVAIPRGAQVSGTVVDATSSGALKGRGELKIALNSVTLGGRVYPLVTQPWMHHGGDKTIETVNRTAGFGAAGAVLGALAGGGEGAAIGGGIGAAAGLGSSAASRDGQIYLPAEGVVTFRLAHQSAVTTVSEQEMQRLAYGSAPGRVQGYPPRRYPIYVAPGYYPGYYRGYYPRYYPAPYGYPY